MPIEYAKKADYRKKIHFFIVFSMLYIFYDTNNRTEEISYFGFFFLFLFSHWHTMKLSTTNYPRTYFVGLVQFMLSDGQSYSPVLCVRFYFIHLKFQKSSDFSSIG